MEAFSKASFIVNSYDLMPEEVSTLLGITPSTAVRKGDVLRDSPSEKHPINLFIVNSSLSSACRLEDHIIDVLSKVQVAKKKIEQLPSTCKSTFYCLHKCSSYSGWTLSVDLLLQMGGWKCEWVFGVEPVATDNQ